MNQIEIWIPKTGEELQRLANVLTNNEREAKDLIKCHAYFGDFFGGHLGKVAANTSCISGKPCLLSDALVGIAYQSGLVRRIAVVESTDRHCIVEAERSDQPPELPPHRFAFTWEMAERMRLIKPNWQKQPANMLKKRARAFLVREVFPEAVSGLYTIDEIADHSNLSNNELDRLTARSLGYEEDYRSDSSPAPTPAPKKKIDPINKQLASRRALYQFETEQEFFEICEAFKIDRSEINSQMKRNQVTVEAMTPKQREAFYYSVVTHDVIRKSLSLPTPWQEIESEHAQHIHAGFVAQYPILKDIPFDFYEYRIIQPPFAETIRLSNEMTDFDKEKLINAIQSHDPTSWDLYEYAVSLYDGV